MTPISLHKNAKLVLGLLQKRAAKRAFDYELIVTGATVKIPKGGWLSSQKRLAKELKLSRDQIRYAIKSLTNSGLIKVDLVSWVGCKNVSLFVLLPKPKPAKASRTTGPTIALQLKPIKASRTFTHIPNALSQFRKFKINTANPYVFAYYLYLQKR